ncbi:MAG: carboxypeptidase regulatory-like domain-containing protein [Pelovirga sp.]
MKQHSRPVLIGVVLLLIFLTDLQAAPAASLEVLLLTPQLQEIVAGEILTLSFRVTNRSDTAADFHDTILLPPGWRLVMPLFAFPLAAGEQVNRFAVVQAGRAAPAGAVTLEYRVRSLRDHAVRAQAAVQLFLPPNHDLQLFHAGPVPRQLIAGEPFHFEIQLTNRGNVATRVSLSARLAAGRDLALSPDAVFLAPGASRRITLTGRSDPQIRHLLRQHLHLEARAAAHGNDHPVGTRLSVPLDIIPLVAGEDSYQRFPLEFSTGFSGNSAEPELQLGLTGSGALDENGRHRLRFAIRAPDREGRGVLGRQAEYRVLYQQPAMSIRAGDHPWFLSPLTSSSRYGRGLGIDLQPLAHPISAGIYLAREQRAAEQRRDRGIYLGYQPLPEISLRLNYLLFNADNPQERQAARQHLVSLQGVALWRGSDRLEAEIARSSGRAPTTRQGGNAWRLDYRGQLLEQIRYSLLAQHLEPDYAGDNGDSAQFAGSLIFPLGKRLRGTLSYRRYLRNLAAQPDRGAANREHFYQAGVRVRLAHSWDLDLGYDYYDRDDALFAGAAHFRERRLRIGLGGSSGALSYRAEMRQSWSENLLSERRSADRNGSLSASWRPDRRFYLTLHGSFGAARVPSDSRLLRRAHSLGGSAAWHPNDAVAVTLHYSRNVMETLDSPWHDHNRSDSLGASIMYRLPNRHRLTFDLRWTGQDLDAGRTSFSAVYVIPWQLPLYRRPSAGSLAGRVYRADLAGQPGVAGALVHTRGTATRTDRNGHFRFRSLPPGDYQLSIDESAVGLDLVASHPEPRSVTVAGGRDQQVDLGLTRAGRLSGRLHKGPATPADVGTTHLPGNAGAAGDGVPGNLLVELSRHEETRRTISDDQGRFLFERLSPGTWTLTIYADNLSRHYLLEQNRIPVTIAPGADEDVRINILPRRRQIRFVDAGRILVTPQRTHGTEQVVAQ